MGTKEKKRQFALTLKWLETNYCICDGVCLPRNIVYDQYLEFCSKNNLKPSCKATFGKVIKTKFPRVTSKRLGARGHSKYHYYGMAIKESSSYYQVVNPVYGLTRYSHYGSKQEGEFSKKYSLSCKAGTLLPSFPEVNQFDLNGRIEPDKMTIFLTMYRTHCQCILETLIGGAFDEVKSFLVHFWQGLPSHLQHLVETDLVCDIIALCDWILYKTIRDILIPNNMQEMSEKLLNDIRCLGEQWENLVETSLETLPANLKRKKIEVARIFGQTLKRNVVFVHLVQTVRPILRDNRLVRSLIDDLDKIGDPLAIEKIFSFSQTARNYSVFVELKNQIEKDATVEGFISCLDELFCSHVLEPNKLYRKSFKSRSRDFLLHWSFMGSRLMRNLTLINAESFVPFHLLRLMVDEYIFLIIESHTERQKEEQLENNLKLCMKNPTKSKDFFSKPGSCFLAGSRESKVERNIKSRMQESNLSYFNTKSDNILTPPPTPSEALECRYTVNARFSGSERLSHFANREKNISYDNSETYLSSY